MRGFMPRVLGLCSSINFWIMISGRLVVVSAGECEKQTEEGLDLSCGKAIAPNLRSR